MDYLEDKERRGVQQEGDDLADYAHLQNADVDQILAPLLKPKLKNKADEVISLLIARAV